MKKRIVIILLFIITLVLAAFVILKKNTNKIDLSSKYYGSGEFIEATSEDLLEKKEENYVLFVYNNYCIFKVPCDEIFLSYMKKNKVDFLSMTFEEFKKTSFYDEVSYAPTVLVIKKNNIVAYLDAEKDEDAIRYQSVDEFSKWINKYINRVVE